MGRDQDLDTELSALEQQYGARIGVTAIDTGSGRAVEYRGNSRFALDSTSKLLTAGLLLRDDTDAQLRTVIPYTDADLQTYSPITSQHVGTGMSLVDLIAAALQDSDNTAANLLFAQLGGPAAVQRQLRGIGDRITNSDRTEPDLNTAVPGDPRDTSTPDQMATDLRRFTMGSLLTRTRRTMLMTLMLGNTTGGPYIRAGVPASWTVADKTGNGGYGTRNDIAVVTPPHRAPLVIAIYTGRDTSTAASDDDLIARTTRDAVASLSIPGWSH
jgi:beta-lactamase class A